MKPCMTIVIFIALASGCGGKTDQPTVADKAVDTAEGAIDSLQQKYDEITEGDSPVQWAAEDLENIGDWDYKVVEFDKLSAAELEAALNELGNDRWQAFWIEKRMTGYTIMLKRTSISYLSKIPLSQLTRMMIGGAEGQ